MIKNFVQDCLDGNAILDDIDDYVEYWHNNDVNGTLEKFIGLDEYESEKWLQEGDDILRGVIYCRRHNLNYKEYEQMNSDSKIAARTYNLKELKEYKNEK